MEAIILHDKEEEVIGTVLLKGEGTFDNVTDAWDKYLNELEDEDPDIYEFVSKGNWEICEVLVVEFYQPKS
jgi:hypothetical protein